MRLYELVDPYVLNDHLENGLVSVQQHPRLPLLIYNYTHKAQYEPHWGDGTIDYCRGLIVANGGGRDYEIIARPFKKFHNLNTASIPETMEENLPVDLPPLVTKKYDGSLGIYWEFDGKFGISTRGSFTSPQANWATKWIHEQTEEEGVQALHHDLSLFTPLFEIVYNENRIVVKYDFEGLVLLGAVNKETGMELSRPGLADIARFNNFRLTEDFSSLPLGTLKNANFNNEEGYVVTYPRVFRDTSYQDPIKVKIKMADYVRLHRIVTGLNAHSLWEICKAGDSLDFLRDTPDHVQFWANQWAYKFNSAVSLYKANAFALYAGRPNRAEYQEERQYRKACANYFFMFKEQEHLKSLYFALLDKKNIDEMAWDMVEPSGADKSFQPTAGENE